MDYDNNSQNKMTRGQFKRQARKSRFGLLDKEKKKPHSETDEYVKPSRTPDSEMVQNRAERDTVEYKQKRLGRRLNLLILVLAILLVLVLCIMRFID
ncbi:hypothetical protein BGL34_02220 [Fructilactobacillus lindneri]|uniref:Uncharacterized protein n=2 Tax=Fructilactobacillus lindneri TaxID=53444 RepID=A0A0R2JMI4_9LACO|nr:hypothetical protein [Fructilactobacillus lindneri]ANZ58018.1 hypothetical protein AYR60_04365 [Fructilactobacillus lindneri]ANZ59288.1 hypothetical protein AYR59_04365 [Fructilactobacillus lindneri]KRN78354.1 hypothetical protein IV52_GL001292 [Fructilactobacillus lindneri DSM 20690 = JCM 11027]POG98875.1 hypothetical protein BGL31_02810 [Fructilactobacillus lindneri]POH00132.1 hypothetical protein BGL33_06105 [Fructilactobacillus lindneri]